MTRDELLMEKHLGAGMRAACGWCGDPGIVVYEWVENEGEPPVLYGQCRDEYTCAWYGCISESAQIYEARASGAAAIDPDETAR